MGKITDVDFSQLSEKEARECLRKYRGLVVYSALKVIPVREPAYGGVSLEDLIAVGEVELLRAWLLYQPDKGKFTSWATLLILRAMRKEVRRLRGLSESQVTALRRRAEAGLSIDLRDYGEATGLYRLALEAFTWHRVSLDRSAIEGGAPRGELLSDEPTEDTVDALVETRDRAHWLRGAVQRLPGRERHVVTGLLYRGVRDADLARELQVSRQALEQIRVRATKRLRKAARGARWLAA